MKRKVANIFFYFTLQFFTKVKCDIFMSLSWNFFYYIVKNNFKRINLRDAIIGSGVTINNGVSFFNKPEIFGNVSIGQNTSISGPATRICSEVFDVKIGSYCSIASGVVIQEFYHGYNLATTYNIHSNFFGEKCEKEKISKGPIIIQDDVWIGSNSVILSGVTIGRGSIVGAGSVVTKNVLPYSIVAGNPAKLIRRRFNDETCDMLEESRWWTWDDQKILSNKSFFSIEL